MSCDSGPWITDAKSEDWYREGEKRDRRTEDLLGVYVADEAARAVLEEMLDGALRDAFLLTMFDSIRQLILNN